MFVKILQIVLIVTVVEQKIKKCVWQFQNKSLEKRGHEKPKESCIRAMYVNVAT